MLSVAPVRITAVAVLVTCFGMNLIARGASETFAVFLLPLEQDFGVSRSQLTGVYSVYMLVHGLAAPLVGMVFDRFGPRISYGLGLFALAAAYLLAARASSLWQLYLSLGALVGVGAAALSMITASGLISRWFQGRLGTAMGLAYAGYGFGVIAVVPLTQVLIGIHGWRTTYLLLGAAIVAFGLPAGSRGPVISTLTAGLFPGSGRGTIYGAITMGMGLGAASGSWASGALFDLTGGYRAGFVFALAAALLALAQFWIIPALRTGLRPAA